MTAHAHPIFNKGLLLLVPTLLIGASHASGQQPPREPPSGSEFGATVQLAKETIDRLFHEPHSHENEPSIVNEDTKPTNNSVEEARDGGSEEGVVGENENVAEGGALLEEPSAESTNEQAATAPTTQQQSQQPETTTDEQKQPEDPTVDRNLSYDGSDLISWINSNGGFIHPNARIGLDPTGQYRGVFVKTVGEGGTAEGIEEGDIIGRIPWDLIVKPKDYSQSTYWSCEALHEMHRQFLLGEDSPHAPYIQYLKNQPRGRIPNEWTPEGRDLLHKILDHKVLFDEIEAEGEGLPPYTQLKEFKEVWVEECGGEDTDLARAAFFQFTSRDEDTLMVPFYDMHNHSNDPKYLNTISEKPETKGQPFILRSIRDIAPGEQIFISYNRCNRCWYDESYEDCVSYSHYGTSQLFDVFGFVEDFPQTWSFRMKIRDFRGREIWDDLNFCLERSEEDGGDLEVTWGDNYSNNPWEERPVRDNIRYLGKQLARLKELESTLKEDTELMQTMPRHEWDMAWRYHEALMTSMSAAILASDIALDEDGVDDYHEGSGDDDSSDDDDESGDGDDESGDGTEEEDEDDKDGAYRDEL